MASHWSFGHLQPKLWAKEGPGVKLAIWFPTTKKSGIDLFPTFADEVWWGVGKLSSRATTLVETSLQSEVGARSCECPKSWESNLGQFRDSNLGVSGKRAIRMWLTRSNADNTIWGKVVASPESGRWWVLCVKVPMACPNTQGGSRMRTNPLVVGFGCRFKLDNLVPLPSLIPGLLARPLPPFSAGSRERPSSPNFP
jgi:hypothetical protein